MSEARSAPDRLRPLLVNLLDGELTDAQVAELQTVLREDASARQFYLRHIKTHAMLHWDHAGLPPALKPAVLDPAALNPPAVSPPAIDLSAGNSSTGIPAVPNATPTPLSLPTWPIPGRSIFSSFLVFGLGFVALLGIGAILLAIFLRRDPPNDGKAIVATDPPLNRPAAPVAKAPGPLVARLTLADGCRWLDGQDSPEPGEALAVGRSLHLASGVVEITFDIGARIILQAPAAFVVESSKSARLEMGKLTAEITSPAARGFKILTPDAAMVDQGTEFGVQVAPDGSSRVHVFKGEVDVTVRPKAGESPATQRLMANAGARLERDARSVTLFEETGESFVRNMDEVHRNPHVVAYWRFEDHPVGAVVPDTQQNTRTVHGTIDSSFNGNDLFAHIPNSQPKFSGDVPAGAVALTGQPNLACLDNSEPLANVHTRDVYTRSAFSHASPIDIQKITPAQWTIEASIKALKMKAASQTFVGRDAAAAFPISDVPPRLAFQINAEHRLAIHFRDEEDRLHEAIAAQLNLKEGQWYHVAAVSNGRALVLYADVLDGAGYRLVAKTDLPAAGSTALGNGSDDAEWSVGRGKVAGHPGEWFQGWIDEVRISDIALDPSEFLFSAKKRP
jgi:Concanavalin A-like lectin/glucanases superfamily/FecR protein